MFLVTVSLNKFSNPFPGKLGAMVRTGLTFAFLVLMVSFLYFISYLISFKLGF